MVYRQCSSAVTGCCWLLPVVFVLPTGWTGAVAGPTYGGSDRVVPIRSQRLIRTFQAVCPFLLLYCDDVVIPPHSSATETLISIACLPDLRLLFYRRADALSWFVFAGSLPLNARTFAYHLTIHRRGLTYPHV